MSKWKRELKLPPINEVHYKANLYRKDKDVDVVAGNSPRWDAKVRDQVSDTNQRHFEATKDQIAYIAKGVWCTYIVGAGLTTMLIVVYVRQDVLVAGRLSWLIFLVLGLYFALPMILYGAMVVANSAAVGKYLDRK